MQCASRKDVPLTNGHIITIIAKAFNVDFAQIDHVAPCIYFTKQAHTRSCWKGIPHPHFVGAQDEEEHAQVGYVGDGAQGNEHNIGDAEWPQDDVHLPYFPTHGGASGSSSHDLPLLEQVLANQRVMQHQLTSMENFNRQLARRQHRMEYKMQQYFARCGYHIESPPPSPSDRKSVV